MNIKSISNYIDEFPYYNSIDKLDVYTMDDKMFEIINKIENECNVKVIIYKNPIELNLLYIVFYSNINNSKTVCICDIDSISNVITE